MSETRPLFLKTMKAKSTTLEQGVPCDNSCPSCSGRKDLAASCIINNPEVEKVYFPEVESEG